MAAIISSALMQISQPRIAKGLKNTFDSMKEASESSTLHGLFKMMKEVGVNLEPLMAPLSLISAKISEKTTESVLNLMNKLFELIETPAVQTVLDYLILIFNNIIDNVSSTVNFLNTAQNFISDWVNKIPGINDAIAAFKTGFDYVMNLATNVDFLTEELKKLWEWLW